ncbi:hypothetical protein JTB14_002316 [Gonioctena quinquepunctata]|nr:hypothetical protein JTB14_002316 [Gonioctena quinquepunctata]
MNPWSDRNTTLWSSECEGATEYWKDHTDSKHRLTIRRKESRKLVEHGTQTFKIPSGSKPAARSGGSRWSTAANQHATGIRWPPSDAPQASLLLERIRQVRNSVPPPRLPQTTPPAVMDDCPRYLLVDKDLCWRCGHPGHQRQSCRKPWNIFCSRCGRCGVRSADCFCGQCPGSRNNKSSRRRGPRRMLLPPLLDLVVTGKVARNCSGY